MFEAKNSAVLESVLKRAREFDRTENSAMTAEKFLLALFGAIDEVGASDGELSRAKELLGAQQIDMSAAREKLAAHLAATEKVSFSDSLYMQKKLYEAKTEAGRQGVAEVTAGVLLHCILSEPSETVREMLSLKGGKTTEEAVDIAKLFAETQQEKEAEQPAEAEREPVDVKSRMSALVSEVKRIRGELQESIYGQDNAINVFATGYFQASMLSMIEKSRRRPRATFLFAGPPGVGKTFLAETAAEALGLPFMRFDMSEYSDKEANIEFCGSDKVYKNAKAGNVTSFVAEHPRCVLLFDEIEKAHIGVIHLFLQMLDAGRLRDNYTDKEVPFTDAIIILTTNAGRQLYEESESGDLSTVSRKVVLEALRKDVNPATGAPYFPAAICSRFASGNIVMFNHIGAHFLRSIAKKEIERHAANLEQETGIRMEIDDRVYTALLFSEGSAADARTVRSRAESFFNDELYELLRLVASEKVETGIDSLERIRVDLDLTHAKEEIRRLFHAGEKAQVLVFAGAETVAACRGKLPGFDIHGVQDTAAAVDVMKARSVDFVMLDMKYGAPAESLYSLNIEDVESPARDFFKFLREQRNDLPVYLIEEDGPALTGEERVSFMRQGVRGVLCISGEGDALATQLGTIAAGLHQQARMVQLARENKLISFETAQTVSADGRNAEIKLFDFTMVVAVDSEDAKSVLNAVSRPDVRFDDVIGADDAKKELTYFVEYLRDPKKYFGTGVKAPKGVLLYGPPGTGKTMLAKAMACESGVTFIAAEGNQFLKKYVGEGSEKVHELFKTARKYAPSILFIDEIDAIAKERSGMSIAGGGVEETLTAFLTEMDGFVSDPSKPVFVLAATNFEVEPGSSRSLDPALMRRFDRRVYIGLPNKENRIRFLKMKIAGNPAMDISQAQIDNIAVRSTGMSLAELDSAIELALRSAIREGSTKVTDAILEEAFETFNNGETKKWDASQLERVARHEAGHALVCRSGGETPTYLTVVARGDHGGYMQHAGQEGKAIYTRDELLARIRTSLGGRAAEIVYYGERDGISTGASGDLVSATNLARMIVCNYGMDDEFGLAVVDAAASGALSAEVRESVNRILKEQMTEAIRIVSENRSKIDALVAALMTKNHLNGAEIEEVMASS